jgi:predicted helicase
MNIKTRKNIIDNFQDINYSILCSAKVLQEGVDIPKCDGIIFIDPKTSIIDTVQSLSRCLTKTDEFKEGNIMIPFDEKIDLINDEYTNNTRLILRNLVENDENLKEFFKEIILLDLDNMTEKEINLLEELKIKYKIDVNSRIIKDLREISYSTFTEARKLIKEKYTHYHDYQYNVINDFKDTGILLPIHANIIYKKFGWISWEHYLGLENEMTNRRIKMIIYKENEIRKKKNMEIIDSKDKFNKFINENPELGIPLINVEYDNWIKFLLKDFDKIVEQYYKKNVLIDIFIKYQIYNKEKYIECMNYDKKLINYEYIINGFYNDSTSFNINDFYITRKKRR